MRDDESRNCTRSHPRWRRARRRPTSVSLTVEAAESHPPVHYLRRRPRRARPLRPGRDFDRHDGLTGTPNSAPTRESPGRHTRTEKPTSSTTCATRCRMRSRHRRSIGPSAAFPSATWASSRRSPATSLRSMRTTPNWPNCCFHTPWRRFGGSVHRPPSARARRSIARTGRTEPRFAIYICRNDMFEFINQRVCELSGVHAGRTHASMTTVLRLDTPRTTARSVFEHGHTTANERVGIGAVDSQYHRQRPRVVYRRCATDRTAELGFGFARRSSPANSRLSTYTHRNPSTVGAGSGLDCNPALGSGSLYSRGATSFGPSG